MVLEARNEFSSNFLYGTFTSDFQFLFQITVRKCDITSSRTWIIIKETTQEISFFSFLKLLVSSKQKCVPSFCSNSSKMMWYTDSNLIIRENFIHSDSSLYLVEYYYEKDFLKITAVCTSPEKILKSIIQLFMKIFSV